MDYKKLINDVKKYHYYVVTNTKIGLLCSSNNKAEINKLALEKLKPNIENLIGKHIYLVIIKSVAKEFEEQKTSGKLSVIGGPIVFEIEHGKIISPKTIKTSRQDINSYIYLSNKYIKKNSDNIIVGLKQVVSDYAHNNLNTGLLSMNIL